MKTCTKCGQDKNKNEFYSSKISSDKLTPQCRKCQNLSTKLNYEKVKSDPKLYFKLKLQNGESKRRCSNRRKQETMHSV